MNIAKLLNIDVGVVRYLETDTDNFDLEVRRLKRHFSLHQGDFRIELYQAVRIAIGELSPAVVLIRVERIA